ncbi:hypothetical protein MCOR02_011724 [Pyricularia oryzae]|nr:hypothetical protein MCOR02_011724 [Pyricularia oryzae]KAI6304498.1 hypothetical protein MCOR34_008774 [Pyricularia oryzae]KAI6462192.1 hypothetical protein MCOR17_005996 [Pyricularia oryzae]KAI6490118.1 hypothetical protein MCOR13_008570 [Pyricularia oryzae]KAI6584938.1 hypothetical protein MCOR04_004802 [Pyricularia oryzae]
MFPEGLPASDASSKFTRLDANLPGGHRHVLNSTTKPWGPRPWSKLVRKDSGRMRKMLSRLAFKGHDRESTPTATEEPSPTTATTTTTTRVVATTTNNDGGGGVADDAISPGLEQKYGRRWKVIGKGAYGTVSIHHRREDQALFAVKEFHQRTGLSTEELRERALAEFEIASGVGRHANVVSTLELLQERGCFFSVMEFCAAGTLSSLVEDAGPLGRVEADCFAKQLLRGVEHLHAVGVAHCDLKPENLLLTARGLLKISDFGCSQFVHDLDDDPADGKKRLLMVAGARGSRPYIAPEEFTADEFDGPAADVWACGVIYMFMRLFRHLWYSATDNDEGYNRYVLGRRLEEGYSPLEALETDECRNVIYSMLDPVPSRRLTASQFLRSEWGRSIQLCEAGRGSLDK